MGLPGSGMPAWGAGGCYPMPGPGACFGAANGPGLMFGGPGFQNVPNFGQVPSNPFVAGQVPSSFQSVPNPCVQNMSRKVPSFSRFPPGGLTPQAANIRQIADLVGTLDGNQTRVLRDMLNERVGNQERMVAEFFGDVARNSGVPFVADESGETLLGDGSQSRSPPLDIFSKSEKWLTPAPVPTISEWKSREAEILEWSDYISQLIAWAAQASEIFANEIGQATRWSDPIQWDVLSKPQKSRSSRLFAILKAAYSNHPMLISVFGEGMSLQSFGSSGMHAGEANANGYELVRQLTLEFSLRSRAEALTVRASLASKSFTLSSSETSPGSIVSDTIRRMDFERSRYSKLIATLPSHVDSTGLSLPEADMLLMLLKSLPISVRDYCLHHSSGESFAAYRSAARRWEEQQRLFQDSQTSGSKKTVSQLETQWQDEGWNTEWYDISGEDFWEQSVHSVSDSSKCSKCGSKRHRTSDCSVDLSKIRCFKCNGLGHIGANCPGKGVGGTPKDEPKGKSKGKSKGKKGKGFARKGKLNEVYDSSHDDWWWYEQDWGSYSYDGSVDQVYGWYDSDWQDESWNEGWTSNTWEQQEAPVSSVKFDLDTNKAKEEKPKEEKPVGSLILSPVFAEFSHEEMTCFSTLELEPGVFENRKDGFHASCELGSNSMSCLQPFGRPQLFGRWSEEKVRRQDVVCSVDEKQHECLGPVIPVSGQRRLSKGVVNDVSREGFFHGLVAEEPFRVRRVCFAPDTFLNECDTVSVGSQLQRYGQVLSPLLSELTAGEDIGWWLLDSGAAVTVLAKHCVVPYAAETVGTADDLKFTAANGTGVAMLGRVELSVFMCLWNHDENKDVWKKARLTALVGDTRYNILSTTSLTQSGWTFTQKNGSAMLVHEDTGLHSHEVVMFAGCPWVRLHPHAGIDSKHDSVDLSCSVDGEGPVCPLSKAAKVELEQHRNQGHTPHNPHCLECSRGRTTFAHRRRNSDTIETEVQADFGFLSQEGEISEIEQSGAIRVLVLTELLSGAIGYVVVGDDPSKAKGLVEKWLQHFGLESQSCSIILHTDAEQYVRALISSSSKKFTFHVRKSRNQQHQSIGGAERTVRRLRETLAILRADLNQSGWDVRFEYEHLQEALTYLALSQNHFSKSRDSDFSPLEMIAERRLSKPVTALFGSTILAEIPSSLKQRTPNETRSIEAAFLHVGIDHGPIVQGKIRVDGERYLAQFSARNIRQVTPISFKADLCDSFLIPFKHDGGDVPLEDDRNKPVLEEGPPDRDDNGLPPVLEPPKSVRNPLLDAQVEFGNRKRDETGNDTVETHETGREFKRLKKASDQVETPVVGRIFTRGCPACESGMEAPGIRHSAKCRRINMPMPEVVARERVGRDVEISSQASPSIAPESPDENIFLDVDIPQEEEFKERTKRKHDGEMDDVEKEVKRERVVEVENDPQLGLFWEDTVEPLDTVLQVHCLFRVAATKPTVLVESLSSIKFEPGVDHQSRLVELGRVKVLVWKPSTAVDDSTLAEVDVDLCFEGMVDEISNMEKCKAGKLLDSTQVDALKQKIPNARVIQARWVVAKKSETKVRARVVAKDIRKSLSARQLGYSSPTPSVESLNIILTYASVNDARLRSLDVSHAFMHSPLPKSEVIVLRMPQSVSLKDGSAAFLHLERALNGLRDASLHWMNLLSGTIRRSG